MDSWQRPGLRAALLYAVAAGLLGTVVSLVSRVELTRRHVPSHELPDGPVIVVSNHTSFADGILLALVGRRLGFIPVLRGTSSAAGSLDAAAEALGAGEAVGLFPEGRITRDPDQWPERSKTGAVRLALRTGAPVVPVAMVGAHRVVGRRRILGRLLGNVLTRPIVRIEVGEPIDVRRLAGVAGDAEVDDATVRRVADEVMAELVARVADLRGEVALHPTGVPEEALAAPQE